MESGPGSAGVAPALCRHPLPAAARLSSRPDHRAASTAARRCLAALADSGRRGVGNVAQHGLAAYALLDRLDRAVGLLADAGRPALAKRSSRNQHSSLVTFSP